MSRRVGLKPRMHGRAYAYEGARRTPRAFDQLAVLTSKPAYWDGMVEAAMEPAAMVKVGLMPRDAVER